MAANFKIGDLVWAKMKGFPPWPGKVSTPPENKRVSDKKPRCYIFFFGSENFAWVTCDNVWPYLENREKYMTLSRPSASFQEAVDAIDNEVRESGGTIPEKEEELRPQSPASMKKEEEAQSATKRGRKRQSQAKGKTKDDLEEAEEEVKPSKSSKTEGDVEVKSRRLSRRKVKTDEEEEEEEVEEVIQASEDAEAKIEEMEIERIDKKQDDEDEKDVTKKEESVAEDENDEEEKGHDLESKEERKSEDKDAASEKPVAVVVAKATRKSQVPAKQSAENQKSSSKKAYLPDILPPATTAATDVAKLKSGVVPTSKKIGFLGIGDLGEALAGCLLATGHRVTIWNRTISKCKDLLKKGATKCSTPSEVVNQCDITFACVSDAVALKDVVFGGKGVLQAITEGKGFVNLSTVDTETTMDVAEAITTRGGRFLEAPLIGSREMSKTGQMLVLTSGEQTLYEDSSSCLKAIGKNVFNLVDLGMASKMQIVLNALYGTTLAGLAESLSLASKVGLDPSEVLEVLGHSSASSLLIREKGNDMVRNKIIDASCRLTTLQRDLRLAINMSEIVDQPLHVGSAVNELFKKAKAKGYGDMDISAIYRAADL